MHILMAQIMMCQTFLILSTPWGTFFTHANLSNVKSWPNPNDGSGLELENNNFSGAHYKFVK